MLDEPCRDVLLRQQDESVVYHRCPFRQACAGFGVFRRNIVPARCRIIDLSAHYVCHFGRGLRAGRRTRGGWRVRSSSYG